VLVTAAKIAVQNEDVAWVTATGSEERDAELWLGNSHLHIRLAFVFIFVA
jgi:hypothetical protein